MHVLATATIFKKEREERKHGHLSCGIFHSWSLMLLSKKQYTFEYQNTYLWVKGQTEVLESILCSFYCETIIRAAQAMAFVKLFTCLCLLTTCWDFLYSSGLESVFPIFFLYFFFLYLRELLTFSNLLFFPSNHCVCLIMIGCRQQHQVMNGLKLRGLNTVTTSANSAGTSRYSK